MKKKFLLIEHGGARKEFVFDALRKKKLNLYLACTNPPRWISKHLPQKNIIMTDTYNSVKLISDIAVFMESRNLKFDAVGTFYEHTVAQTADLAASLNLIGINPGAARRSSSNKLLMRKFCRDSGVETPKFKVIKKLNKDNLEDAINEIGLPCVIKPIFGAESYGTIKIDRDYKLNKIMSEIKSHMSSNKKEVFKNFTGNFLVEEYLSGPVVSVDGIINRGNIMIAGTVEFIMGPEPRFTQEANYIPARFDNKTVKSCKQMAIKVIRALGFDNCGFHCEQRITPKGPRLIEIAARLPGGPLQPGYKKAYGVDLTSLLIDVWLGKKIKFSDKIKNYVLQKAVFPKMSGQIKNFYGLDKVKKIKGVWNILQIAKKGENVITYPDIPKPFYYYAISAKSKKQLEQLSKKVEFSVKIDVSKL